MFRSMDNIRVDLSTRYTTLFNKLDAGSSNRMFEESILKNYFQPNRHFHNLGILDHQFRQRDRIIQYTQDRDALDLALFYHDVHVDSKLRDNEERSADLMVKDAKCQFPLGTISSAYDMIMSSRGYKYAENNDNKYFLDIDLSLLGVDAATWRELEILMRMEYDWISDDDWYLGRLNVLNEMIKRGHIFQTDFFIGMSENDAVRNILTTMVECQAKLKQTVK